MIAIAGVGGGLGPVVAERLAAAGATVAGCDGEQGAPDEVDRRARVCRRSAGTGAPSTCSTRRRRGLVRGAASSASAGSTGSFTWSAAGAAGSRCTRRRSRTGTLLHDLLIRTVQHTTRAFHDALLASEHGRFVLVSAKQAQAPSNSNAAYAAAKAAAEAWTLALADGFGRAAATANIVVVDAILTPRMRERDPDGDFPPSPPPSTSPTAIAFLCSDAAEKMNGQRLALTMG